MKTTKELKGAWDFTYMFEDRIDMLQRTYEDVAADIIYGKGKRMLSIKKQPSNVKYHAEELISSFEDLEEGFIKIYEDLRYFKEAIEEEEFGSED